MAFPTVPTIDYSYTAFQQAQGKNEFPGTQLDNDLAKLTKGLEDVRTFLERSFRSDGGILLGVLPTTGDLTAYGNDLADVSADSVRRYMVDVTAFGSIGDGVTDDYGAFAAAYAAVAWGGTIRVPQVGTSGYYLSANPDAGGKPVTWDFDTGVQLCGAGIGAPGLGAGGFGSLATNPWLRVGGKIRTLDLSTIASPRGGAVIGDSLEVTADSLSGWPKSITGTITHGSAVMTAVSDVTGIQPGYAILAASTIPGWPAATSRTDCMRVISVDPINKTIVFGPDDGAGSGVGVAGYSWTGATAVAASFFIRKRHWMAGRYEGMATGAEDNVDVHYEICNTVLNITGAAGVMYEFDLQSYAETTDFCRAILITGAGDVQNSRLIGIDIMRGGTVPWATALSIRHARVGVAVNAQYPISIDTVYENCQTGGLETINYGIHFSNAPANRGALLEGRILSNGGRGIVLWRNTDVGPSGRAIQFKSADDNNELFFVAADGGIKTYAPSNSNGSAVAAGSIECNGITLRGGTNLQLGVTATPATKSPTGNYIVVYDSAGGAVYLPTYA